MISFLLGTYPEVELQYHMVILQVRFQQYMSYELPDIQVDLEKAEEPEIKLPTLLDHVESKRIPENYIRLLH